MCQINYYPLLTTITFLIKSTLVDFVLFSFYFQNDNLILTSGDHCEKDVFLMIIHLDQLKLDSFDRVNINSFSFSFLHQNDNLILLIRVQTEIYKRVNIKYSSTAISFFDEINFHEI